MKTITIRDLRQRWPEAEAALKVEDEILITRDSKPVAKLVRIVVATQKRPRWDMEEHARLITLDEIQAKVASALDYEVIRPGQD